MEELNYTALIIYILFMLGIMVVFLVIAIDCSVRASRKEFREALPDVMDQLLEDMKMHISHYVENKIFPAIKVRSNQEVYQAIFENKEDIFNYMLNIPFEVSFSDSNGKEFYSVMTLKRILK